MVVREIGTSDSLTCGDSHNEPQKPKYKPMRSNAGNYHAILVALNLAFCGAIYGQTSTVTTKEISTSGTISSFEPNTLVIRSETATAPMTYSYSASTQYVNEAA